MGFQFLDSSIVFVFNLMKIIILGTSVVGNEKMKQKGNF